MKTIEEMIAVMQAAKEGKEIEWAYKHSGSGVECCPNWNSAKELNLLWNWACYDYRIKPMGPKRVWMACCRETDPKLGMFYLPYSSEKSAKHDRSENIESVSEFIELTPEIKAKLGL